MSPGETVIVRVPNWIGDVVMCSAGLECLARAMPDANIVVIAKPWVKDVLVHNPHIAELIIHKTRSFPMRVKDFLNTATELRSKRASTGVLFHKNFESALMLKFAGVKRRWGRPTDSRGFLLTDKIEFNEEIVKGHQVFHYIVIAEQVTGVKTGYVTPKVYLSDTDLEKASEYIENLDHKGPLVPISAGAAYGTAKCWPPDLLSKLLKSLDDELGAHAIFLGGQSESDTARQIINDSGVKAEVIAGQMPLLTQAAIVQNAGLCISNDSGLMHVAASLENVRVIGLFGPTKPAETAPFGDGHIVHHNAIDCWPCKHRSCPTDHLCMRSITVNDVLNSVETILASR